MKALTLLPLQFPRMAKETSRMTRRPKQLKTRFFCHKKGKLISISTTRRWIRRLLAFHFDHRKKTFFVDEHERPDVVFHRNDFCTNYLSKLEPRTHRWIQVAKETIERWKLKGRIGKEDAAQGYIYHDSTSGKEMVEFHVDDFDCLHFEGEEMLGFGAVRGDLSVRKPAGTTPLMIFG